MAKFKTGILSEEIRSMGGTTLKKGQEVKYIRKLTQKDKDGFRLTKYEWHYCDINGRGLIRTIERTIEGLPYIKEEFLGYKK